MPILDVDGVKLNALVMGSGPPIVMLHGMLLGNLSSWYLAAGSLAGPGRRVVLYDLRGHGNSESPPAGYGLTRMASDLGGLARALALDEPLDLAGFSYGSLVALRFALDEPHRVRRLVLVETPLPPLVALVERYLNADIAVLLSAIPEGTRKALLASPRRIASHARRLRRLIKETSLVDEVRAEPAFDDAKLKNLTVPTLCIYGDDSEFLDDGRHLTSMLPNARLVELPGCSHQRLGENLTQTARLIKELIDG